MASKYSERTAKKTDSDLLAPDSGSSDRVNACSVSGPFVTHDTGECVSHFILCSGLGRILNDDIR